METLKRTNEKVKGRLSCCKGLSRKWVLFMNGVVMLSGIVLLTLSIFNGLTSGDVLNAIGTAGIVGPIVAGSVLVVTAGVGICGVLYKNKFLLVLYILVGLAMSAVFLGAGIVLTFLANDLNNIDGEESNTFKGKVEGQLNDFLIAVFNKCCFEEFEDDGTVVKLLGCDDPEANQEACFTFIDDYEAALDRVEATGLCNTLENVEVDGIAVVGDPVEGGCAGGNGVLFKAVFTDLVEDTLVPIGAAFISLGAVLIVTLLATCVILCANQDEYFSDEEEEELKAKERSDVVSMMPPPAPNTFDVSHDSVDSGKLVNGVNNPKYRPPYEDYSDRGIGF